MMPYRMVSVTWLSFLLFATNNQYLHCFTSTYIFHYKVIPITEHFNKDAGIYAIPGKGCPEIYIPGSDDIGRSFNQQNNSKRGIDHNSALVEHIIDADHRASVNDAADYQSRGCPSE